MEVAPPRARWFEAAEVGICGALNMSLGMRDVGMVLFFKRQNMHLFKDHCIYN